MATPTNHWKLGLFVVVAFMIALGTMVALGARSLQKKTVGYKSYFDESVQGLDVGFFGIGVSRFLKEGTHRYPS